MTSDTPTKLLETEKAFRRSCRQIVLLNNQLEGLQKRYDIASQQQLRSFRYSLRLRMAVTEGVRNMYYEYASIKADEITELRIQLLGNVELSDSDEDYSFSEYLPSHSDEWSSDDDNAEVDEFNLSNGIDMIEVNDSAETGTVSNADSND